MHSLHRFLLCACFSAALVSADAADSLVSADTRSRDALLDSARAHEADGEFVAAVADYDAAVALAKPDAELLRRRGIARFMAGDPAGAVADFDAHLAMKPDYAPHDWMRGIALYYADEFALARKQFEDHQAVNPDDVENAAWHFLCVARLDGVEKARAALIPIDGDRRVPMAEVHALFAGDSGADDVLAAARIGDAAARRNQLCYAHLYLGLYFEALGVAGKSRDHIRRAAGEFAMPHFMGQVARVHAELRAARPPADAKARE